MHAWQCLPSHGVFFRCGEVERAMRLNVRGLAYLQRFIYQGTHECPPCLLQVLRRHDRAPGMRVFKCNLCPHVQGATIPDASGLPDVQLASSTVKVVLTGQYKLWSIHMQFAEDSDATCCLFEDRQ
mgnify:CR=1 FL=1